MVEACRNRDLGMLDLLLKSHARDDECKALFIAAHARDEVIVSKLLALKVRQVVGKHAKLSKTYLVGVLQLSSKVTVNVIQCSHGMCE